MSDVIYLKSYTALDVPVDRILDGAKESLDPIGSTCLCCNEQIWWKKIGDKWKPFNNDDTPHSCSIYKQEVPTKR